MRNTMKYKAYSNTNLVDYFILSKSRFLLLDKHRKTGQFAAVVHLAIKSKSLRHEEMSLVGRSFRMASMIR